MSDPAKWRTPANDLAAAVVYFEEALPGWWWSVGMCSVSGDASCGVDRNGVAGNLLKGIPLGHPFDEGFHADLLGGTPAEALREVARKAIHFLRENGHV